VGLSHRLGTGFDANFREEGAGDTVCESFIALRSLLCSQKYCRAARHKKRWDAGTSSFLRWAEQALAVGSQYRFWKQSLEAVYISQEALQVALALSF